jgi:hypothetical protein
VSWGQGQSRKDVLRLCHWAHENLFLVPAVHSQVTHLGTGLFPGVMERDDLGPACLLDCCQEQLN